MFKKILTGALIIAAIFVLSSSSVHVQKAPQSFGATNAIPTPIALFESSLASSITASATSMTLVSATDKEGTSLNGTYAFILDEGTVNEEFVNADCVGTACTNMTRGLSVVTGNTSVASLKHEHRRGASVKITDAPQLLILHRILNGIDTFPNIIKYTGSVTCLAAADLCPKSYVDGVAVAGAPNASTTVKGIAEEATQAEIDAATGAGGTAARLFVNPSTLATSIYGTQLPSSTQKQALVGTSGTPSTSNKYVTDADATTTSTASKIVRADASGKIDDAWLSQPTTVAYTLGENISANQAVYIKPSDGKSYKASSAALNDLYLYYLGIASETGTTAQSKKVRFSGYQSGFSFGATNATVAATTETTLTAGTSDEPFFSAGMYVRQTFTTGLTQENISSFTVDLKKVGAPNNNLTVAIYAIGTDGQQTGSALQTKTFIESDLTTSYVAKEIITTPFAVTPNTKYIVTITTDSDNLSTPTIGWFARYNNSAATYIKGELFYNNAGTAAVFWDGTALNFVMKYTAQRNYYIGDDMYLNDTAGAVGINPGTTFKKVGEILSTTEANITDKYKGQYLGQISTRGVNGNVIGASSNVFFPFPRNTSKVIVQASTTASANGPFEMNVLDLSSGLTTWYVDEANDFTITANFASRYISFSGITGAKQITLTFLR